jgi:GntR family transcriptional regulator
MERLRLADGRPLILERRWVPVGASPELTLEDMSGSLYAAWTTKYGLAIAGAEQTIRAVNIGARDAAVLELTEGTAGLLVTCTGFLHPHVPLWFERTLYRGDSYEFRNQHGAVQSGAPASGRFLGADGAPSPSREGGAGAS